MAMKPIKRSDGRTFRSVGAAAADMIAHDGCGNQMTVRSHIAAAARGDRHHAYGYRWEYV